MQHRRRKIKVVYLTYPLRLAAAATQVIVVFYLDSVATSTLGLYSFYTALLAILMQLLQFEGHFLTISGELERRVVADIYKFFSVVFSAICLFLYVFIGEGILLAFIYVFILNLSSEWVVNYLTIEDRMANDNSRHFKYMSLKIFVVDVILPLAVILSYHADIEGFQSLVLLIGILVPAGLGIGYSLKFSPVLELKFHYFFSVFVKRTDTMLLRLATGTFFGTEALGLLQPLLSVCRVINILTPTLINMNFLKIIDIAKNGKNNLPLQLVISYVAYLAMSPVIYLAFTFIQMRDYGFVLVLVTVLYFGNQNTKALLRSIFIAKRNTSLANCMLFFLVATKALYLPLAGRFDVLFLVAVFTLVDAIFAVYMLRRALTSSQDDER